MIRNYFKTAWRNIKKHPAFSLIKRRRINPRYGQLLLLVLYVTYNLSYDRQFKNADNLYMVENNQPGDGKTYTFAATPGVMALAIKSDVPGVVNATRVSGYMASGLLSYKGNILKKERFIL